jgi:TonB family protein
MRSVVVIAILFVLIATSGHAQQSALQMDTAAPVPEVDVKTMTSPRLLNSVEPESPSESRAKEMNGRCAISLVVDLDGKPENLKVVRCSDPAFEKSSLDTVAKYHFKPATRKDGTPIAVQIFVTIGYMRLAGGFPATKTRYGLFSPPGTTSDAPGADGVYPLSKSVAPPAITKFSDEGFGNAAFIFPGNAACVVVLTVSAKGKPPNPSITQCDKPVLEKPAIATLLQSRYTPGTVNGAAVPVRMSVRLEFDGFYPTQ